MSTNNKVLLEESLDLKECDDDDAPKKAGAKATMAATTCHTIKCHLCINCEISSNSHLCAACVNIYLENLHTRYEINTRSVKKLRGTVRARLKKLQAVSTALRQAKPSLEELRAEVQKKRELVRVRRANLEEKQQQIEAL